MGIENILETPAHEKGEELVRELAEVAVERVGEMVNRYARPAGDTSEMKQKSPQR